MLSVNDFFSGGKITKKFTTMQVFPLKSATNSDVDYILQFASPSDDCLAVLIHFAGTLMNLKTKALIRLVFFSPKAFVSSLPIISPYW